MISQELIFSEFIEAVKDKDKLDILRLAESEAKEAEKISEIKVYGLNYYEVLREFIYFMRYQQKPYRIKEEYFQMFRSVCENLVAKKQLSPDIMKLFDSQQ
jgi:hypothetical protein